MAKGGSNSNPDDNYRGSARDYPKSPADAMAPGRGINVNAGSLDAKDMSSGAGQTKRAPQKI